MEILIADLVQSPCAIGNLYFCKGDWALGYVSAQI